MYPIREDNRYGGIRAIMQAHLAEARIHLQIDIGFGDAITPAALDLDFPTLLVNMPSPNVLAYPMEKMTWCVPLTQMVPLGLRTRWQRRSHSRLNSWLLPARAICPSRPCPPSPFCRRDR